LAAQATTGVAFTQKEREYLFNTGREDTVEVRILENRRVASIQAGFAPEKTNATVRTSPKVGGTPLKMGGTGGVEQHF